MKFSRRISICSFEFAAIFGNKVWTSNKTWNKKKDNTKDVLRRFENSPYLPLVWNSFIVTIIFMYQCYPNCKYHYTVIFTDHLKHKNTNKTTTPTSSAIPSWPYIHVGWKALNCYGYFKISELIWKSFFDKIQVLLTWFFDLPVSIV